LLARLASLPGQAQGVPWAEIAPALETVLEGRPVQIVARRHGIRAEVLQAWEKAARACGMVTMARAARVCQEFIRNYSPLLRGGDIERGRDWPDGASLVMTARLVKEGNTASVWLLEPGDETGWRHPESRLFSLSVARDDDAGRELLAFHALAAGQALAGDRRAGPVLSVPVGLGARRLLTVVALYRWTPARELRVESVPVGGRRVVARLIEVLPSPGEYAPDGSGASSGRPLSPLMTARIWRQIIGACVRATRFSQLPGNAGTLAVMPLPCLGRDEPVRWDGTMVRMPVPQRETVVPLDEWLRYLDDPYLPMHDGPAVHWPIGGGLEPAVRDALTMNPQLGDDRDGSAGAARAALTRIGLLTPQLAG
jgi:hypothetical protein